MKDKIKLDYEAKKTESIMANASQFCLEMSSRRSVRDFDSRDVPKAVIEQILTTANLAPSGANKQPWTFCAISNPEIKKQIRIAAEKEEYENYHGRMSESWLEDLNPLGTDWNKPFLEIAPWLIVVFKKSYNQDDSGKKSKNYYVSESVGIACGFLIAAIHKAGLVTLTHTPSPMNFLQSILSRPDNEKPFLLLPVGYPQIGATVPNIVKKAISETSYWY